ncbi:MAG: alpha/beta hydrolase [Actinomycetota bacterium]
MSDYLVTAHDEIDLAVRDYGGEGPDVLFVHGAQRTLEDWTLVLQHVSGIRAVAFDLRMHGRSGVPAATTLDDFVRDIDTVVREVGLSRPLVIGHSFGGVLALQDVSAHHDRAGVVDIDGFDFRQSELYDQIDAAEVDTFLDGFRFESGDDNGDEAWLEQQREMMSGLNAAWQVPDDVATATFERIFVREGSGWVRRPPNTFFDLVNAPDGIGDPLGPLRQTQVPAVLIVCRPPGESGMFAEGRKGLERHVRTIASERPQIRLETIDATHGVIFEQPDEIARIVASLL